MATVSSPDIRHTRRVALKVLNPELGAVLGGLLHVVHPWLGNSDEASRAEWRRALARMAARKPRVVVAGHKKSLDLPDSPEVLSQMDRYLADFDSLRKVNTSGARTVPGDAGTLSRSRRGDAPPLRLEAGVPEAVTDHVPPGGSWTISMCRVVFRPSLSSTFTT